MRLLELENHNVVIAGGGLAGIWAARKLVETGIEKIVVLDPRTKSSLKSLFVQGEVLRQSGLYEQLLNEGRALNMVNEYLIDYPHKNKTISVGTGNNDYFAVDEQALISAATPTTGFSKLAVGIKEVILERKKITVGLSNGRSITTKVLIDATGSGTPLSRYHVYGQNNHHLPIVADNPLVMWCKGERLTGRAKSSNTLYHPASPNIGSASWVLPNANGQIDVIASGFCRLSELKSVPRTQIYLKFLEYCLIKGYLGEIDEKKQRMKINGFIRVQPVGPSSAREEKVFIIGDAAGMGSPVFGEVIPAILSKGYSIAEVIKNGGTAADFYRLWRHTKPQFPYEAEQAVLIVKNKISANNRQGFATEEGAGNNAVFYEKILHSLPPGVQKEFLLTRKLPIQYIPKVFLALVSSEESLSYLKRFCMTYLHVWLRERNAPEQ